MSNPVSHQVPSQVSCQMHGDVAVLAIDAPPVNALSHAVRAGLVAQLARAGADARARAIVLIGAGKTFSAGGDLREFGQALRAPLLNDLVALVEASDKPVIAALHGQALGGGLELALSCHARVALAGATLGLPEVKVGILPGAGGTQRLPRLIGVAPALRMIVEGNTVSAAQALELGLVDAVVDGADQAALLAGAIACAHQLLADERPLRRTGALVARMDDDATLFETWKQTVAKKQRGLIAPLACIEAVRLALTLPLDLGLQREHELGAALIESDQARALRHVFFAERAAPRVMGFLADSGAALTRGLDAAVAPRDIRKVGVVGPGTMGIGIAICFLNAGLPVLLLGRSADSAARGAERIRKSYAGTVARGGLAQGVMDQRMALLSVSAGVADLKDADLVIESVAENLAVKQDVFRQLDAACKPGAILATNTSYLDIDTLASATQRPADVVGMHFFNPANVMRLLENVRGAATAPEVIATVMALGQRIGKIAVLAGNCEGFIGNRMLAKRSREGFFLLEEGATPWQIDKVLSDFGFPMGPYALADLAGIDVAWAARQARLARMTPREQAANILDQMHALGRYGQKTGAGYYRYDEQRKATPDPAVEELIVRHSATRGITRRPIADSEIRERCVYALINEGALLLEQGMAARAADIDIVWVRGLGFPAHHGGPLFYADLIGVRKIHETMLRYRDQVGAEYWTPAPLIAQLARDGRGFYSPR